MSSNHPHQARPPARATMATAKGREIRERGRVAAADGTASDGATLDGTASDGTATGGTASAGAAPARTIPILVKIHTPAMKPMKPPIGPILKKAPIAVPPSG